MHVCLLLKATNIKLNVQVTNILDARHDGVTCLSCFPTMCCPEIYLSKSFAFNSFASVAFACVLLCAISNSTYIRHWNVSTCVVEGLNFKWKYTFVYFRRAADHPMYMYVDFLQVHLRMHLFPHLVRLLWPHFCLCTLDTLKYTSSGRQAFYVVMLLTVKRKHN